jgi:exodeoxyribonuclease VII small subunit
MPPKAATRPEPAAASPSSLPEPASYEAALAELEGLIRALEANQLPLDQLIATHQRGAALLAWCRGQLQAVEQQVQVFEDGLLKPLAA